MSQPRKSMSLMRFDGTALPTPSLVFAAWPYIMLWSAKEASAPADGRALQPRTLCSVVLL
jgi:hypothetical protein